MIDRAPHRVIGLLRPQSGSVSKLIEDHEAEYLHGKESMNVLKIRKTSDAIREMIEELAECLELQPYVIDCEITGEHATDIMSRKRKKRILGADVLALVDPEPRTLAWGLNSAQHFPLQTLVVASTDEERSEHVERLLGNMQPIPSFKHTMGRYRKAVSKFFALSAQHSPGNFSHDDIRMLRQALLFPKNNDPQLFDPKPLGIHIEQNMPRKYLVEDATDADVKLRNEFTQDQL